MLLWLHLQRSLISTQYFIFMVDSNKQRVVNDRMFLEKFTIFSNNVHNPTFVVLAYSEFEASIQKITIFKRHGVVDLFFGVSNCAASIRRPFQVISDVNSSLCLKYVIHYAKVRLRTLLQFLLVKYNFVDSEDF